MSHIGAYALPSYSYIQGFTGNIDYAVPNATQPVAWWSVTTQQVDADIALLPLGGGALLRKIPSNAIGALGGVTGGNKRGPGATDFQRTRAAADEVASGADACIPAGNGCKASGAQSFAMGQAAYALGAVSFALGQNVTAQSSFSSCWGYQADTYTEIGCHAQASGIQSGASDSQRRWRVQRRSTANATPTVASTEGTAATVTNTVIIPNFSSMKVRAEIIARTGAGVTMTFNLNCSVTKQGAGTAAMLGGAAVAGVVQDGAGPGWLVSGNVSGAANNFEITVTGAAATNILWVIYCHTLEARF